MDRGTQPAPRHPGHNLRKEAKVSTATPWVLVDSEMLTAKGHLGASDASQEEKRIGSPTGPAPHQVLSRWREMLFSLSTERHPLFPSTR